jgi:hypothetical protein
MAKSEAKQIYTVLFAFQTKDLEVTVHFDTAKTIMEAFLSDQTSIRFRAVNGHHYAVDYRGVQYIRAKPLTVELEE